MSTPIAIVRKGPRGVCQRGSDGSEGRLLLHERGSTSSTGITSEQCKLDIWSPHTKYGKTWQEVARLIDSMTLRMTQGCKTVEVNGIIALYKFMSLCPAYAVNYAQAQGTQNQRWKRQIQFTFSFKDSIEIGAQSPGVSRSR